MEKYQYTLVERSSNNVAENVKYLSENTSRCNFSIAMSIFFRFGILPDNLEKHALQIAKCYALILVTVAITWLDQ